MENKELTLKVSNLLGSILSRLLVVETEYQIKWNTEEKGCNGKTRANIILEIRDLLNQLNAYGISDYYICDYSKILHDYE